MRNAESHVTTLGPGAVMHPGGHSHPDDEILIMKEGAVEVTINGVPKTASAGSMIFYAGGDIHSMRNASDKPATYYVLRFIPRDMLLVAPKAQPAAFSHP